MDKQIVVQKVIGLLEQKMQGIEQSIAQTLQDAREAPSAMESHSDTTRNEKQRFAGNLDNTKNELLKAIKFLRTLDATNALSAVQHGSLVETRENDTTTLYFMMSTCGGDRFQLDGNDIVTLSSESPLGKTFMGKKRDDTIAFQTPKGTKNITIVSIC